MSYWAKMKGSTQSPPGVGPAEIFWSWLGSFLGIALVALISFRLLAGSGLVMIIGSFGASAVLIYGAVKSPLAQPRNLLGGHVLSAVVGVACVKLLGPHAWLTAALAVSLAIALMHASKTLHPPGGATALIAVIGGPSIQSLGWLYVLVPVGAGAAAMLAVALLVNNIPAQRSYPEFWW